MSVFICDDQLMLARKLPIIQIGGREVSFLVVVVLSMEDLLGAPRHFIKYPSAPNFFIIETCLRHSYHGLSTQHPLTFINFMYITGIQTLGLY